MFKKIFCTALFMLAISNVSVAAQTEADYVHSLAFLKKLNQTYPELKWLAGSNIATTQENTAHATPDSWSQQIFGKHYPEYDRTVLSIISLHLLRIGDYNAYKYFIASQPAHKKLRFNNFQKLNLKIQELQKWDPQIIEALETALVLRDVGKTSIIQQKVASFNLHEDDHDLFYAKIINKYPLIFPSFNALSLKHQQLLQKEAHIIHYGHFSHLEGGPEILKKLEKSNIIVKQPWVFDFNLLTHLCDVAAASGHRHPKGAYEMNEETFKIKYLMRKSVLQLKHQSRQDVLKYFMDQRAAWINQPLSSTSDYIIVKIASMLRLTNPDFTKAMNTAFDHMSQTQKNLIHKELYPLKERDEMVPTYLPAVLLNIFHNTDIAATKEERLDFIFTHTLPFIAQILHDYRHDQANIPYNPKLTLNFNDMARIAKEQPERFQQHATYRIESNGSVTLI